MKLKLVITKSLKITGASALALGVSLLTSQSAFAMQSNVSGYVPLKQSPVLEANIERVLIAAELGAVKRPISNNQLNNAYQKVCENNRVKNPAVRKGCIETQRYLKKVSQTFYVNHASATLRFNDEKDRLDSQAATTIYNQRGELVNSSWSLQAQGVYNINQYALFSAGAKAWKGNQNLEDTYFSVGIEQVQLDIGYKPHWLSPFKNSAMLLSTNAPTFANISLSNNTPLTSWNINYELFAGELSETDNIRYQGGFITGSPMLTGLHLSFSPFPGFTLAVNRILQSGGGERDNDFGDLIKAFFDPSGADNTKEGLTADQEFGNQAASIVSRFDFIGNVPFSVYMEYAGEDTSRGTNYRLGNSSLSAGIELPVIFKNLSFNYEYSQWQNGWYVHHVYKDGLQNDGSLIGHFAAELRQRDSSIAGHGIGATHHNATLGWQKNPSNRFEINYNQTRNESVSNVDYVTGRQLEINWFKSMKHYDAQFTLYSGKNTLSEKNTGISVTLGW